MGGMHPCPSTLWLHPWVGLNVPEILRVQVSQVQSCYRWTDRQTDHLTDRNIDNSSLRISAVRVIIFKVVYQQGAASIDANSAVVELC